MENPINKLKKIGGDTSNDHLKPVNVIIGRFQPMTIGHLSLAKELYKENGLNAVYIYVRSKSGKNSQFSTQLTDSIMSEVVRNNPMVEDAISHKDAYIPDIIDKMQAAGYNPVLFGAGSDRAKTYKAFIKKVKNDFAHVDLGVKELTGRLTSGTAVRELISNNKEKAFQKLVPKGVKDFFTALKLEYNTFNRFVK